MEYMEPKLVDLDEGLFVQGPCVTGTGATGVCFPGTAPGAPICRPGVGARWRCRSGSGARRCRAGTGA